MNTRIDAIVARAFHYASIPDDLQIIIAEHMAAAARRDGHHALAPTTKRPQGDNLSFPAIERLIMASLIPGPLTTEAIGAVLNRRNMNRLQARVDALLAQGLIVVRPPKGKRRDRQPVYMRVQP